MRARLAVILTLLVLVSGCERRATVLPSRPTAPPVVSPAIAGTIAAQQTAAATVFERFPSETFSSLDDAQRRAGFPIVRAASRYKIAFDRTYLDWRSDSEGLPLSSTKYLIPPSGVYGFEVEVGTADWWSGENYLTSLDGKTIGALAGWYEDDGSLKFFAFRCATALIPALWCVIRAPASVSDAEYESFIMGLAEPNPSQ